MSGSLYDDDAGECDECETPAPKNQLEAYDGICGACWHNQSQEQDEEPEVMPESTDWKDKVTS